MRGLPSPQGLTSRVIPLGKASSTGELTFPVDSPAGVVRPSLCVVAKAPFTISSASEIAVSGAAGFYGLHRGGGCSSSPADSTRSIVGLIDHDARTGAGSQSMLKLSV